MIGERTRRSLRSICASTHNSGLLPLMKEGPYTGVYIVDADADVSPRIISATRRPLADRSGARGVREFIQSIPRGGDSGTARTNEDKLLSYQR